MGVDSRFGLHIDPLKGGLLILADELGGCGVVFKGDQRRPEQAILNAERDDSGKLVMPETRRSDDDDVITDAVAVILGGRDIHRHFGTVGGGAASDQSK